MRKSLRALLGVVVLALVVLGADTALNLLTIGPFGKAALITLVVVIVEVSQRIIGRLTGHDVFDALELAVLRLLAWKRVRLAERSSHYMAPFLTREEVRWVIEQAFKVNGTQAQLSLMGREVQGRVSAEDAELLVHARLDPPRDDEEVPESVDDTSKLVRYVTLSLQFPDATARELPRRLVDLTALLSKVDKAVYDGKRMKLLSDSATVLVKGWTEDTGRLSAALEEVRHSGERVRFSFSSDAIAASGVLSAAAYRDMQSMVLLRARWKASPAQSSS